MTVSETTLRSKMNKLKTHSLEARPAWDRTVDTTWTKRLPAPQTTKEGKPDTRSKVQHFSRTLKKLSTSSRDCSTVTDTNGTDTNLTGTKARKTNRYFSLPNEVRFKICQHLISIASESECHDADPSSEPLTTPKPVRLTDAAFDKGVWPDSSSESLQSLCSRISTYLAVCTAFRHDVLATILVTQHFRITLGPYVGRLLNKQGFDFLEQYGAHMTRFTLEVDLSRLENAPCEGSSCLSSLTHKTADLTRLVVRYLSQHRPAEHRLAELDVLVRRYRGKRPGGTPYCRDSQFRVLDAIKGLGEAVDEVRLVGCSEPYVGHLMRLLWPDLPADAPALASHCRRTTPSNRYPQPPAQSSYLDFGPSEGICLVEASSGLDGSCGVAPTQGKTREGQRRLPVDARPGSALSSGSRSSSKSVTRPMTGELPTQKQPAHLLGHPALQPKHLLDPSRSTRSTNRRTSDGSSSVDTAKKESEAPSRKARIKARILSRGTPLERGFG
jgi:hypothetical protein